MKNLVENMLEDEALGETRRRAAGVDEDVIEAASAHHHVDAQLTRMVLLEVSPFLPRRYPTPREMFLCCY